MKKVRVWPTLVGALILTEDAIAFGFYPAQDIPKLQRDLEQGMPLNQAAGFSGSVYPVEKIRRVRLYERHNQILVEYRDFVGGGAEDFTFQSAADFQDFCRAVPQLLGLSWRRMMAPGGSRWGILIPLGIAIFMAVLALAALGMLIKGVEPPPGEPDKRNFAASLGLVGCCALISAGAAYWLVRRIKNPPLVDCLQKS